jgi:hypothetical protein
MMMTWLTAPRSLSLVYASPLPLATFSLSIDHTLTSSRSLSISSVQDWFEFV